MTTLDFVDGSLSWCLKRNAGRWRRLMAEFGKKKSRFFSLQLMAELPTQKKKSTLHLFFF